MVSREGIEPSTRTLKSVLPDFVIVANFVRPPSAVSAPPPNLEPRLPTNCAASIATRRPST